MKKLVHITLLFITFASTTGFYLNTKRGNPVKWNQKIIHVYFCHNMKKMNKIKMLRPFARWQVRLKNKIKFIPHLKDMPLFVKGISVCFDPFWNQKTEYDTYALTKITWGSWSGTISKAKIVFNQNFYRWTRKKKNNKKLVNFEGILLHEIGHALGLLHSSNKKTVMHARPKRLKTRTTLHKHDIIKIRKLYKVK